MIRIAVAIMFSAGAATAEVAGATGGEMSTDQTIGTGATGGVPATFSGAVGGELDAVSTGGGPAATPVGDPAALYTVLARHGCSVTEAEVADLFGPEGFAPAFVSRHLSELLIDGGAALDHAGRLHVSPDLCPPEMPAPSPRDRFVAAFASAGCSLTDGALRAALPDLSEAQLLAIATPMVDGGALETGISGATLASDICTTD